MADQRGFRPFDFLRDASRNSPWVLIAVALHVFLIAGAAIFYTAHQDHAKADEPITILPRKPPPVAELPIPPEIPPVRTIPPMDDTELTPIDTYIVDQVAVESPMDEVGDPNSTSELDAGGSTANGVGTIGTKGTGPAPFQGRGPGLLPPKGTPPGKTPTVIDMAVLEGLRWLARHQNEDGSWSAATLNEVCPCDEPVYNPKKAYPRLYDTGLTSLALLAFLGAGISHEHKADLVDTTTGKRHKAGEIVKKGLRWLVAQQNADGSVTPDRAFLYNEALAAMALSEAYGLTQHRLWREPAQKSLDFLQAAQRPSPHDPNAAWGWRYVSRQEIESFHRGAGSQDADLQKELFDADISVTGWAVMALKSGQLSRLQVSPASLAGGVAFARHVTQMGGDGRPTGLVGYLDPKSAGAKVTGPNDQYAYHPGSMSALGMCIRIFAEHDALDPFLKPAADQIVKDLPAVSKDGLSVDYYYWYYASLALNQLDGPDAPKKSGKYWPAWNKAMVDAVLALQDKTRGACSNGGWMQPDRWSLDHGGPLYATALNVLTLEVYYRYENAFGGHKRN